VLRDTQKGTQTTVIQVIILGLLLLTTFAWVVTEWRFFYNLYSLKVKSLEIPTTNTETFSSVEHPQRRSLQAVCFNYRFRFRSRATDCLNRQSSSPFFIFKLPTGTTLER